MTTNRISSTLRGALLPLVAALVLAGCASTAELSSGVTTPVQFKENAATTVAATAAAPAQADGAWWRAFNDSTLDALVERAAVNNTSVQQAAARLAEARAIARTVDADRSVQVGLGAGANRGAGLDRGNGSKTPATLITAGANVSWELDLFGRLSGASNAAALDAGSREALLRSAKLAVQAEVAQSYLALRALDDERAIVRETVEAYRGTLSLTERRFRAGDLAELDVARVQTEMASTESDALALDRQRAQLEHALAVLTGDVASQFELKGADWTTTLPSIPAGLPSTVLERRPDVAAAQRTMQAAQSRVGVAKAAWFPSIALTGAGGYASSDLGDLFKWSARSWGVGALMSLPLLDGGRREAGVQGASAQLDGALASYREQVLVAFREVEDQLSALRLLEEQSAVQARAVASAKRATVLSDARYRNGYVSQLDLLDARRSELRNRRQALQVKSAQYQATVGLIRALGGGWEAPAVVGKVS
ncbi:efflux transporter outer membrane subunit [Variovorax sp. J22G21]|uniref:efflux transporter outer membrane subunit n=1 Tax=Variovorax fucosicus TaxID=3053517 RepID=UPI00257801B1|nr:MULTISPECIES: efflux transporter outer membrane subunit [unclassified Variovorax]MDM0038465.1 efflux transporter outer membrane subunit [Variovorax sp. J22R193]MDM0055865.1 efflux transporter outer membrane subunit [Variovorax sp. J22G47]MDM0063241.1 efflux transporter outer membrane subunit [Variovorax sp. J22G21]